MTYMLTSGSAGENNKRFVIDEYRRRFTALIGAAAAAAVVDSTAHLNFGSRVWNLEEIFIATKKKMCLHERSRAKPTGALHVCADCGTDVAPPGYRS